MKDRSLLILLAVTVVFVLYVKPARDNIGLLRTRISLLNSQIAAQQNVKRQSGDIEGRLKAAGSVALANEAYLYPPGKSNSLALVDLQDFIKGAATANHMEILTSTWGEPAAGSNGLIKIPMTFLVKGLPADLDGFLAKIYSGPRFLKTERANITKFQDQLLVLNISLVAFKREASHE